MNNKAISVLAISGSLKLTSANTAILKAINKIAPQNVVINIFNGLGGLPYFNPESSSDIEPVDQFRQQVMLADGVIFSTPEYAFGIPGVLKNALDWVVFSGEFNKKPVVAISASPLYTGGEKALASLLLTLTALGANICTAASLSIADIKSKITGSGEIADSETVRNLKISLDILIEMILVI